MRLSVVIPGYDPDIELLIKAIKSVICQNINGMEIIYVDDGSKEDIYEAVNDSISGLTVPDGCRIKVKRIDHKGVSAARNAGIGEASGDIIMFVDGDDELLPGTLKKYIDIFEKHNADEVIGPVTRSKGYSCVEEIKETVLENENVKAFIPNMLSTDKLLRYRDCYIGRGPYARLIRADIVKKVLFDESLSFREDVLWNLNLLLVCKKVVLVNRAWYYYYYNPNSVMQSYKSDIIGILESAADKIYKFLLDNDIDIETDYCDYLYQELVMIYRLFLGNEKNTKAKVTAQKYLYDSKLWKRVGEKEYTRKAAGMRKVTSLLYRHRLLFCLFDIEKRFRGHI